MPIYYSTGSKLRAFMWATLSGVSEPVGALFGYLVLGGDVSNMAYGSMFGIVAGMMVYISLAELLPSAYRFEKNPAVVTASMVSCLFSFFYRVDGILLVFFFLLRVFVFSCFSCVYSCFLSFSFEYSSSSCVYSVFFCLNSPVASNPSTRAPI